MKIGPLGTTLANEGDANPLQKFCGSEAAFRQPHVGLALLSAIAYRAGEENGGKSWCDFFGFGDEIRAAHFRHHQVSDEKIDSSRAQALQRMFRLEASQNAIASRLQGYFAN